MLSITSEHTVKGCTYMNICKTTFLWKKEGLYTRSPWRTTMCNYKSVWWCIVCLRPRTGVPSSASTVCPWKWRCEECSDEGGWDRRYGDGLTYSVGRSLLQLPMLIGASVFTCGNLGPTWYICVAVKNKVLIYELNRTKVRYEKKKVSSAWAGVSNVKRWCYSLWLAPRWWIISLVLSDCNHKQT